ncbi:MAG: hypothetical protein ACXACY_29025 [Candidatus Hodarchaeales archaeon]|jgi:hypothetical protein
MILFAITSINNNMINLLLEEYSRESVVVVTTRSDIFELVKQYSIHCHLFLPQPVDVSLRDESFAVLAMPGIFENQVFADTDLEIWKVLSIDRLKFWYSHLSIKIDDFIQRLDWDKAYVSLDLNDALPWIAADEDREVIAVQTVPLKTREMLDMARYLNFSKYIVSSEADKEFLLKICPDAIIETRIDDGKKEVEFHEKSLLKKGLGIPENEPVFGLFFDRRDEWQCRKWLDENAGRTKIFVVPTDNRSHELLYNVLHRYLPYITIYTNTSVLAACDSIVAFRFDEGYVSEFKDRIMILDYGDINKVKNLV